MTAFHRDRPRAIVIAGPGTNRDQDVAFALERAGADPEVVLAAELIEAPRRLEEAGLLIVAGGFSYGDALGAGRMLALDLELSLHDALRSFIDSGRPVLGICNGFQVLTRAGLLPGALGHNRNGHFECRWVTLEADPQSHCIWTSGLTDPIECPIAHGEGRYVHPDPDALAAQGLIALRYGPPEGNPNGSVAGIAGVTDETGLVLGLMPHPENHVLTRQHPRYPRQRSRARLGLWLFERGVDHVAAHRAVTR